MLRGLLSEFQRRIVLRASLQLSPVAVVLAGRTINPKIGGQPSASPVLGENASTGAGHLARPAANILLQLFHDGLFHLPIAHAVPDRHPGNGRLWFFVGGVAVHVVC